MDIKHAIERLEILEEGREKGTISKAYYDAHRARILGMIERGMKTDLDNREQGLVFVCYLLAALVFFLLTPWPVVQVLIGPVLAILLVRVGVTVWRTGGSQRS